MPVVNNWDADDVFIGGSSIIEVFLSDAEMIAITADPSQTQGWFRMGFFSGGTYGDEIASEALRDEGGTLIRNTETTNDFVISNTLMQTTANLHLLIDSYLSQAAHKYRYILPTNAVTTPLRRQILGMNNALADKNNWTAETSQGSVRGRELIVRGTATDEYPKRVIDEVTDWTAEGSWPASLGEFLTDHTAWPSAS